MTQEELINVFKYIIKKCDILINNGDYEADDYTQDTVEDIAELCNHILDGDYGKFVEVKEVDLEKECSKYFEDNDLCVHDDYIKFAKHFFELGLLANNPITAADKGIVDEIIFALNALGKEKMISYDKELEWLRNKVKKGK